MAHAVLVLLAWHPDLVVPTLTLHAATVLFVALCVLVAMVLYMVPMKMVAVVAGFYYLRHPMFRDRMPAPVINFFRRLPSMSERIM